MHINGSQVRNSKKKVLKSMMIFYATTIFSRGGGAYSITLVHTRVILYLVYYFSAVLKNKECVSMSTVICL